MKKSKNLFKLVDKENGEVFWNGVFVEPLGKNRVSIKVEEYDINPNIQAYFTNTRLTTKRMDDENKLTIFNMFKKVGFYDKKPKIG